MCCHTIMNYDLARLDENFSLYFARLQQQEEAEWKNETTAKDVGIGFIKIYGIFIFTSRSLARCKKYCSILNFIKGLPNWRINPTYISRREQVRERERWLQIWFMFAFLRNLTLPDKSQLFLWQNWGWWLWKTFLRQDFSTLNSMSACRRRFSSRLDLCY